MIASGSAFFDCTFLYSADDVAGEGAYVVFEDAEADPFMRDLTAACRGRPAEIYRSIEALRATDAPVFIAAPVWHRHHRELIAAGIRGARAKVLLYFDSDPSGYWDFAKGCQGSLARLFRTRVLDDEALKDLGPFLEQWLAGRPFAGRMTSLVGQANREFKTLLQNNGAAITRVFSSFSDEISRSVYARMLFGTPEDIFKAFVRLGFGDQQYMELVDFTPGEHLVNCGVGRGWELPYFICKMKGEGIIYNFDCNSSYDSSPFGSMLRDFSDILQDHLVLLGAFNGEIDLPVAQGNMVRSSDQAMEGQSEKTTFPIRTLDSLFKDGVITHADYIKMDVEGGEKYILEGALDTIKRLRPKLAVAIYHEPNHFWDYPSFLLDNLEDYNYYLRQYGYSRFETLLYAIPKERAARAGPEPFSRTTRATRKIRQGLVSFYLFDEKPRNFFIGPHRILARFEGAFWPRGDVSCAPRIEADKVVGVWEDGRRCYYATRHRFDDGYTRVSFGRSKDDPLSVDWRYTFGCADDAQILPIWNTRGALGVAVSAPGLAVGLGFWDGGESSIVEWRAALDYVGAVHLVLARSDDEGGGYEAYLPHEDPGLLHHVRFDADGRRTAEAAYRLPVAGGVCGVVRVKRFVDGVAVYEPGFAIGKGGAGFAEILVLREDSLQSIGSIDLDPGSVVVQISDLDPQFDA